MEAALDFYRLLGVEIEDTIPIWAPHHRAAGGGGGLVVDVDSAAFAATWNKGWTLGKPGVVIGVRVPTRDSVDRLYGSVVEAGYSGQQEPYDAFWGARYALVEDPDGNTVGIMSPIDDDQRTAPPDPSSF